MKPLTMSSCEVRKLSVANSSVCLDTQRQLVDADTVLGDKGRGDVKVARGLDRAPR